MSTSGGDGGGGVALGGLKYNLSLVSGGYVSGGDQNWVLEESIPFDPASNNFGEISVVMSVPLFTYVAGEYPIAFTGFAVTLSEPSTFDAYDMSVNLIVTSLDGTQQGGIVGSTTFDEGEVNGQIGPGDVSFTQLTGTDLNFDVATGEVTSTLGGVFQSVTICSGGWD